MYPQQQLNRLAVYKAVLRRDIAYRRAQCTEAAARVAQPVERLDRVMAFWRRLSPFAQFAAVPLGFLVQRTVFRRRKILGSLLRWGPLIFGAVRGIRSVVKAHAGSAHASNHGSR